MSKSLRAFVPGVCLVVYAAGLVACGGHSTSPTAPSSTAPSAAASPSPSGAGATIAGTIAAASGAGGIAVGVAGTTVTAMSDGAGYFSMNNVPAAQVVLTFSAPGVSASAPVGAVSSNDLLQVSVTLSGSVATVDAQQRTAADNSVEAEGTVSEVNASGRQFKFGSTVVSVPASASITRGGAAASFTELANGDRGKVRGMKDGAGVRASDVTVEPGTAAPAPPAPTPSPEPTPDVTLNGLVAGLAGTCPALTMTVAGTAVTTSAATSFNARICGELRNGDTVYAIGPKQGDGSIAASKIYYVAPPVDPTVTLSGTVSNVGGAWPVITLTVQGKSVKTSSATTCDGTKGCSLLANGDSVTVVGTTQSDGTVLASKLTNATPPPAADVTVNGPIVGLTGTCPALSMSVAGTAVKTTSATTFNARICSELRNGDTVYAIGPKQGDGSIAASKIYYVAPVDPTVTLTGTVSNLGGAWPVLTLTVQGKSVKTSSATTCDGTKGCSLLANGDSVTVVGTTQSDGSVLASKLTNATPPPAADVTVNGPIVGLTGTCPVVSMSVAGTAVKTTATTVFTGRTCAELRNGDTIYAIGPKQGDGSILASKIYYIAPQVTLSGTVSNLGGAYPVFTLTVQGKSVKTSSATTCDGTKGCSLLANGDSVTVVGTTQGDGSVLASKLTNATPPPPADTTLNGVVAGLGGTCPALSMTVGGVPVKTTTATIFNNKSCADLKNGDTIYAIGPKQGDGSVIASKIYFQK